MLSKDVARNANWLEAEYDGKISSHEARMLFLLAELMVCTTQYEEVHGQGAVPAVVSKAFTDVLFEGFRGVFGELLAHGNKGETVMMSAIKTAAKHVQKEHEEIGKAAMKRYIETHGGELGELLKAFMQKGGT